MVDRLEELLAMMDDGNGKEEEEREDVSALMDRAVPAAVFRENGGEAVPAGNERQDASFRLGGSGPGRAAGEIVGAEELDAGEKPDGGPVWRLDSGAVEAAEAAWRQTLVLQQDEAAAEAVRTAAEGAVEATVERLSVEKGGELARAVRHEAESGLEGLYRQTVRASRSAAQALPVEQAGRTLRAEEPGRTAALTVDELDRAVRRDSWRYDGGMTIY